MMKKRSMALLIAAVLVLNTGFAGIALAAEEMPPDSEIFAVSEEPGALSDAAEETIVFADAAEDTGALTEAEDPAEDIGISADTKECIEIFSDPAEDGESLPRVLGSDDPKEEYYLPLFQTSDIHGHLADLSTGTCQYRLAYISDKVKDVRGSRNDLAVLLDGGDIFQGNTMSNLLNGTPISEAFDIMGYDAVTIGNHEFDWRIETVIDPDKTLMDYNGHVNSIPVVSSNLYKDDQPISFAHEYIILEKTAVDQNGRELPVKIGVIGLAGQYANSISHDRFTGAGYSVSPGYDRANELAAMLEETGTCDATILLTHEEASLIASKMGDDTSFDLVLGGHTHFDDNGVTSQGLRYMQPSCYGQAYVYCELVFCEDEEGGVLFQSVKNEENVSTQENISLLTDPDNTGELDPLVVALTDQTREKLKDVLETKLGYITTPLQRNVYLSESGDRSTTCGNWICSILAGIGGADVAFMNNGGLRKDIDIPEGQDKAVITLSHIVDMFPFNNEVYVYEITWEDLLTAFKYSLTDRGKTVLSQMIGVFCYYTESTVNAIVTRDGTVVYANGVWKDGWKDKKVKVALQSYAANSTRVSSGGMANPFNAWNKTDRLISDTMVDTEEAPNVLRAWAEKNDGLLMVDTAAYYINREYTNTPMEWASVSLEYQKTVYDGKRKKPAVTVTIDTESGKRTLTNGEDYTVEYENNLSAGKGKVVITGKGAFAGSISKEFTISPASLKSVASAQIPYTSLVYNGKARTQTNKTVVKASLGGKKYTLKLKTDYTVSYKNNTKVGTATIIIKGKGNYNGSISRTFKIRPKAVALSRVRSSKKGQISVSWKKTAGTTGYQVQYARNSGFTSGKVTKTVASNKTVKKTFSGLKAGRRYWIRIRAYKTVNGKKYYSSWSKAKTVTVKR